MSWETDLSGTLEMAWRTLVHGVEDKRAAARHVILATAGREGGASARIVILRAADPEAGALEIHTDTASAKVQEIAADPNVALVVWDPRQSFQIRMRAEARLRTGEDAAALWAAVPEKNRRAYTGYPPPGVPIPAAYAHDPEPEGQRFAVIDAQLTEIETLHLGDEGHARARFRRAHGWAGTWLAP